MPFPGPAEPAGSPAEVLLRCSLDRFRSRLAAKLATLPAAGLCRTALPSGWTPLELARHLRYAELRWPGARPATLERVLLHLLQEYARHLGQLDVVAGLATGSTGE